MASKAKATLGRLARADPVLAKDAKVNLPADVSKDRSVTPVSTSATRLDPTKTTEQPLLFKRCAEEPGAGRHEQKIRLRKLDESR